MGVVVGEAVPERDTTAELVELVARWSALFVRSAELSAAASRGRAPDGVWLLGEGNVQIRERLALVESRCRRSVRALQPGGAFDPTDDEFERDELSRRRGIRMEMVAPARAGLVNPFLRTVNPHARCGPVLGPAILVDDACAVLPGVPTRQGGNTAWVFTRPEVVADVVGLWRTTLHMSRPATETAWPRLTTRQFTVARQRALGRTHAAIARAVGVSERTVSHELAEVDRHVRTLVPAG